jgi:hypothetical protein
MIFDTLNRTYEPNEGDYATCGVTIDSYEAFGFETLEGYVPVYIARTQARTSAKESNRTVFLVENNL